MDGVLAAARGIRPYLADLVGAAGAAALDTEIAQVLRSGDDSDDTARRLREVLERRVETRRFLESVLDDAPGFRPPQYQEEVLKGPGFDGLPGDHSVRAPLFRCPEGNDYDWRRPSVGTPVPMCPTHRVPLVRA